MSKLANNTNTNTPMTKEKLLTTSILLLLFIAIEMSAYSPRMYIIEEFTNTSCDSCAVSNELFNPYLHSQEAKIIPIIYHTESADNKDPFYKLYPEITKERGAFYHQRYEFNDIPMCFVNGNQWSGSPYYTRKIDAKVKEISTEMSPIDITLEMSMNDSIYTFKAQIKSSQNLGTKKLYVFMMDYSYSRYEMPQNSILNGEVFFYWIPRQALTSGKGLDINLALDSDTTVSFKQKIDYSYKNGNTYLVAFIQDTITGEILQAATNLKPFPCAITFDKPAYRTIGRYQIDTINVTFRNYSGYDVDYNISAITEDQDWKLTFANTNIYLNAGDSITVPLSIMAKEGTAFADIQVFATPIMYYMKRYYGVRKASTASLYYLVDDVDMLTLSFGKPALQKLKKIQNGITTFKNRWATMPVDVFYAGYSDKIFDLLYINVPAGYEERWGTDSTLEFLALEHLRRKKHVIISATKGLTLYQKGLGSLDPTPALRVLCGDVLGIKLHSTQKGIVSNAKDTRDFDILANAVTGYKADELGSRLRYLDLNTDPNQYIDFFESIEIIGENTRKLSIYCDHPDDVEGQTASILTKYGESKCAYLCYGFENTNDIDSARHNLIVLLEEMGYKQTSSTLSLSTHELTFFTLIDSIDTQKFTISNSSKKPFKINSIELKTNHENVFDYYPKDIGSLMLQGYSRDITVSFYPYSESYYEANIVITTDANILPKQTIHIFAYGEVLSIFDNQEQDFNVYPNPASDKATLSLNLNKSTEVSIFLADIHGRKTADIFEGFLQQGFAQMPISCTNISPGQYYIVITSDKKYITKPIVILK